MVKVCSVLCVNESNAAFVKLHKFQLSAIPSLAILLATLYLTVACSKHITIFCGNQNSAGNWQV